MSFLKALRNKGRIDYAKEIKSYHRQSRHQGDTDPRRWGAAGNFYPLETGSAKRAAGNHHTAGCAGEVQG
ncbi:hypothetical protein CCP4SC76_2790005 [Gammaproteobacteria bacterium]